ncbi:MAG: hypothetical protein AAGH46_08225, partial [Bacteroidota bacterium]
MLFNPLFLQQTTLDSTGCFWCWAIWMFLSALLGLSIGFWIWGSYAKLVKQKEEALKSTEVKTSQIEKAYMAAKFRLEELEKDNKGLKATVENLKKEVLLLNEKLEKPQLDVVSTSDLETQQLTDNQENLTSASKTTEISQFEDIIPTPLPTINYADYLKPNNLKVLEGIDAKM